MTIEQAFFEDTWEVHCDKCSYHEEFEVNDFSELIHEMKRNQWKSIKTDTGWEHICMTCQDKDAGLL